MKKAMCWKKTLIPVFLVSATMPSSLSYAQGAQGAAYQGTSPLVLSPAVDVLTSTTDELQADLSNGGSAWKEYQISPKSGEVLISGPTANGDFGVDHDPRSGSKYDAGMILCNYGPAVFDHQNVIDMFLPNQSPTPESVFKNEYRFNSAQSCMNAAEVFNGNMKNNRETDVFLNDASGEVYVTSGSAE